MFAVFAGSLVSCVPGGDGIGYTRTPNVFSERTREVGRDQLTPDELTQLSRTLKFIQAAGNPSAADPDCIVHEDGGITCLKEGAWICWCDAPDTSGGECGCANF